MPTLQKSQSCTNINNFPSFVPRTVLPRIKPSELQVRHKIGEGSFSVVYAATWNGVLVAEKLKRQIPGD